jgi:hypothetical protein
MSNFKVIVTLIEKFDRTNWLTWSFSVQATLMFMDAWGIAEGTESRPPNLETEVDPAGVVTWLGEQMAWDKRE